MFRKLFTPSNSLLKRLFNWGGCYIVILLMVGVFILTPKSSLAVDPIITQVAGKDCSTVNCSTDPDHKCCGNFTLDDFIAIAIAISKWILGITGSLALLMFIYGGVMFLISSGNTEQITKAKQILIGSVIGLIIVFASWTIIKFVFGATGLKWEGKSGWPTAETTTGTTKTTNTTSSSDSSDYTYTIKNADGTCNSGCEVDGIQCKCKK